MPAFKVRATQGGTYGGHFREAGDEFWLVDIKDGKGRIIQTAEEAYAEDNGKVGWMERVEAVAKVGETPEQRYAREAAEAQAKADMEILKAGGRDLNDPANKDMMMNAAGTAKVPKLKGGAAYKAPEGSNATENAKAGATPSATAEPVI
jgi:hypothetical protein